MIRLHEFNTRWWGAPVGIVDDGAFFALPPEKRKLALAPYRWAEFRSNLKSAPPFSAMHNAGFLLADTQLQFRIGLKSGSEPCREELEVRFASETPFELEDRELAPFEHERYGRLPHGQERTNARFGAWGRQLIREHPETCIEVLAKGEPQGWFLSQPSSRGLNLALAMLRRSAQISGFLLYEKGLASYAARGHRIGWASFSVTNTAVHNIYAKLGAHFVEPTGIWMWIADQEEAAEDRGAEPAVSRTV
jgi:hypothetical protein